MSELRNIPGVGTKTEQTLIALGYGSLKALRDADPDELYIKACLLENEQMDKCALYVFRCAVAYAKDPAPNPNEYRWWFFTDDRKNLQSVDETP